MNKNEFYNKLFNGEFDNLSCGELAKMHPEMNPLTVVQQPQEWHDSAGNNIEEA